MIAKIKRNLSLGDTISYNLKDESQLIDTYNLKGNAVEDYKIQMELTQKLFTGRAKNLTAHIILSPSPNDGKQLTIEKAKEIAYRHLVRMELDKNQAILFLHEDKEHIHLHIVVNRINRDGKIYRTRENEMIRCQRAGNIIAKELGMRQAGVIEVPHEQTNAEVRDEDGLMAKIRQDCSRARMLTGPPNHSVFNLEKYFDQLKVLGYKVKKYRHAKANLVYGYGLTGVEGHFYKASSIGEEYTISNLSSQSNSETRIRFKARATIDLLNLVDEIKDFNAESYFESIRSKGYEVKFHFEKDSKGRETTIVRGYSVGKDSIFIPASELSPELTLKKLKTIKSSPEVTNKNLEQHEADISKIISCLSGITSGHRYNNGEDFVKSLEAQKLKVNLRYSNGELSGYTISLGKRKYKDTELSNGAYALDRLRAKGIVKLNMEFDYPERRIEIDDLMKAAIDENNKRHIREAIGQSKGKISKLKSFNESDLYEFMRSMALRGFSVRLHFTKDRNGKLTSEVRGYSVGINEEYYSAFVLGKEFTLLNLSKNKLGVERKKNLY